ncbi:MAG: FAD-dependent oxidoreductase [Mycoplasmatales bacterium]|nr:FAD-dependent oxidoreductase [Mycoplasmatales bacterium]
MKVISVGTNHAGTSFVRTLAKVNKDVEITAYDKNTNISFLGCGIALWVGGEFEDPSGLFYSDKEQLESMGIKVKMEHEIVSINEKEKFVTVKNLKTGEEFNDSYDKLVFAGGTWPIVPPFPGVELENIFLSKLYQHAQAIKKAVKSEEVKNVVVIGAGYIGIELVEAFYKYNKKVTLIDMEDRVVPRYFDKEFTDPLEAKMKQDGINLRLGEKVSEFKGENGKVTKVVTDKGEYDADMVIMSIGFRPQTKLLEGKVDMIPSKAIKVDSRMRTSSKDIYAIGDSAALMHNVLGPSHVALATNAVKSGLVAAMDIAGAPLEFPGVQGTNGIDVFGHHYTSTGISEETAKRNNIKVKTEFLIDKDRPEFMKNAEDVQIKIVYDSENLKLLGAQIGSFGSHVHTEAIFMLSLAIQKGMTLPEIALIDVYFLPHYNKPFNYVLQPILNALGLNYTKK